MIKVVMFDFGGVLADEGFEEGLDAIGQTQGIDGVYDHGERLIYETGYVLGLADERLFWEELRRATGIKGTDDELRAGVLKRFRLRPEVLGEARGLKEAGLRTAILSDQTNWLDEIDASYHFYQYFDRVFNSYRMHKGKRDASVFGDVCRELGVRPQEALFIDDKTANVERAAGEGLRAILFKDVTRLRDELREELQKSKV